MASEVGRYRHMGLSTLIGPAEDIEAGGTAAENGQVETGRLSRLVLIESRAVAQSAIVSNKRLDAVLAKISSDQQERDRTRLANRNVTLRQKQRIRASMTRADVQEPP